jgi:transposase-like protein
MPTNTSACTLSALRRELDHYRRLGKRAVFPEALKHKVVALSDEYSVTVITQSLGLSSSSFQRWKQQLTPIADGVGETSTAGDAAMFVSLPEPAPAINTSEEKRFAFSITLCCDSPAREINFQGKVTLTQWADLLRAISRELLS